MRHKDKEHVAAACWLAAWLLISPLLLLVSGPLLTDLQDATLLDVERNASSTGDKASSANAGAVALGQALFPCPWMVLGITCLGAASFLFCASRLCWKPEPAPLVCKQVEERDEVRTRTWKRIGAVAFLQAFEIGLGYVAQTDVTLGLRNAADMATPSLALIAGLYLGTEPRHRSLVACAVCATIGGLLAGRGSFGITSFMAVPLLLGARAASIAKWMFARAWLTSMDPMLPSTVILAQNVLFMAGTFGIEMTVFLQSDCFGAILGLSDPKSTFLHLTLLAVGLAIWLVAELQALKHVSATLLALMLPLRCLVLLPMAELDSETISLLNWLGLSCCLLSAVGFAWFRMGQAADIEAVTLNDFQRYMVLPQVTKTVLLSGDRVHYPRRGDMTTVHYVGSLASDGTIFDMGMVEIRRVGMREVIEGWDAGLMQMSLGERAILEIPAAFGYGRRGIPAKDQRPAQVPPNADLVFKVQLQAINTLEAQTGQPALCPMM